MRLNDDFSQRVVMHAARMDWIASPMAGVDRRMLDRVGAEVARATSIVRYAPGSAFAAHTHGGGEEFLVLAGVFSDEHGDYPAGSYIRNPPMSRHVPGSAPGCVIFVKLWQFDPADRTQVLVSPAEQRFEPDRHRPNVTVMPLFRDPREDVRLERWAPGAAIAQECPGGMEVLVLEGGFTEGGDELLEQSWLRLPAGAVLRATSGRDGAKVWVKTGHLAEPVMSPEGTAAG